MLRIPLVLQFNVADEVVRLADTYPIIHEFNCDAAGKFANPPKLKIETVVGVPTPVLTLTGTQNFTDLVETSSDLVNGEPMAAVTLDAGVNAALTDPAAPGLQLRFYRAVSP